MKTLKEVVFVIILLLVATYVGLFLFETYDTQRALAYSRTVEDPVFFNPQTDYAAINNAADLFYFPGYLWSKKRVFFNNFKIKTSKSPVYKAVVFGSNGTPTIMYISELEDLNPYLIATTNFVGSINQGNQIPQEEAQKLLVRGTKLKAGIIVGSPNSLPDGMAYTKDFEFAYLNAVDAPVNLSHLINPKVVPINDSLIYPASVILIYE